MVRCMETVGTPTDHASSLADVLVEADHRGHYSHGLNRLEMYVKDIRSGLTIHDMEPQVLTDKAATAWVEGNNLLGPVVGKFCMDLAIKKAKEAGIGFVVAKGSNHYGIAGWYSSRACNQGLLGLSMTNTSPVVVPTRAKEGTLGTNPITLAAPAQGSDSFHLDMSTSTVAFGKVEIYNRRDEAIPDGWGCDKNGIQTHDPKEVLIDGGLLPLGGLETTGGYKGYGLGMMVEVLCGILGGAHYGPNIRHGRQVKKSTGKIADLGQCFMAIDPSSFAPGFTDRMSDLMNTHRNLTPVAGGEAVLVPGDPEKKHIEMCTKRGGIPYHPNQITNAIEIAKGLGISPPTIID